jgi:hypothetical protein
MNFAKLILLNILPLHTLFCGLMIQDLFTYLQFKTQFKITFDITVNKYLHYLITQKIL